MEVADMVAIRKWASMLVMAIFVLSIVPLAWAEKEDVPKGILGITKKEIKEAKEQIKEARETGEQLKEQYKTQKKELKEIKEKVTKCKENTEDCKKNKENWGKGVKQHLLNTNQLISDSLSRLKERVQDSNILSEEDKTESLAKIDELEAKLTAEMEKVNAMADTATKEELKAAVKELKDLWQEVRSEQRKILTNLVRGNLENLVEKHDEYSNSMEARIQELRAQGVDVSELKVLQQKFAEQMDNLKADTEAARNAWIEAKAKETFAEASNYVHQAQQKVKEGLTATKETLREFMKKYRELKAALKASEETEVPEGVNEAPSDNLDAATTA